MNLRSRRVGPSSATAKDGDNNAKRIPPTATPPNQQAPQSTPTVVLSFFSFSSIFVPSAVYYFYSAPEITLVDSGELCLAAAGPGVAHPAGFPAWVLISHIFTRVLPSLFQGVSEIRSVNLVSVVAASIAIHLLWRLCRRFAAPKTSVEELGPFAAAMLACFAFPVWGTYNRRQTTDIPRRKRRREDKPLPLPRNRVHGKEAHH